MDSLIRIALVDDQTMFRNAANSLINVLGSYEIVLEANEGNDLFAKLEKIDILPDICLLDLQMPIGLSGYSSLPILRKKYPKIAVVVLTTFANEDARTYAMQMGAAHFLGKGTNATILDSVLKDVYESWHKNNYTLPKRNTTKYFPTEQEMAVIKLCADGYNSKKIGERLNISHRTVEKHIENVKEELGLPNMAALISNAFRCGWVS